MQNRITSEEYLEIIIPNDLAFRYERFSEVIPISTRNSIITVPVELLNNCSIGEFLYSNIPSLLIPLELEAFDDTQVELTRSTEGFNLRGRDVIIGFIDTGIDYTHKAFIYPDNTTRIISIWDQTIQSDTVSERVRYGSEFTREQINQALASEDPFSVVPSKDESGHGTKMAGIAAGNEMEQEGFSGIAPSTELIVVKLKEAKKALKEIMFVKEETYCFQETDVQFAINYMVQVAQENRKPLVFCIGLGTSQDAHTGTGSTSFLLSELSTRSGIGAVIAAGNEADTKRHYSGLISPTRKIDEFELTVSEKDTMFFLEIWGYSSNRISIVIESPHGEKFGPINPTTNECIELELLFESTQIIVNNILAETESLRQLILIRFKDAVSGVWKFRVHSLTTEQYVTYDAWLPMGDIISRETYFSNSTELSTVTSPGNAGDPMTVGAYNSFTGEISPDSGRGPNILGTIKPDYCAPGVNLKAPIPGNLFGTFSGTSAATSVAAGCVALIFEWAIVGDRYANLSGTGVKTLIIRGIKKSPNIVYPNNEWGYGILDVYTTIEKAIKLGVNEV